MDDATAPVVEDLRIAVVLPAAGTGVRTTLAVPKQFWVFGDQTVLQRTVMLFEQLDWIQTIIVPVSNENLVYNERCKQWGATKTTFIIGGEQRHESIMQGVLHLGKQEHAPDVVVVHDVVRPFASPHVIAEVVKAAELHGAAGCILPLVSTIVRCDGEEGFLDHSLDRNLYRASQTPQAFKYDVIARAYDECAPRDIEVGTECLHLAQRYANAQPRLVKADEDVWKITHKRDLLTANQVIQAREFPGLCTVGVDPVLQTCLQKVFSVRETKVDTVPNFQLVENSDEMNMFEALRENFEGQCRKELRVIVNRDISDGVLSDSLDFYIKQQTGSLLLFHLLHSTELESSPSTTTWIKKHSTAAETSKNMALKILFLKINKDSESPYKLAEFISMLASTNNLLQSGQILALT